MCGIAGMVAQTPGHDALQRVERVAQMLHHRGPDDGGYLQFSRDGMRTSRDWQVREGTHTVLVHRRLSILDLSDSGWQPMKTPDSRYAIAFNGEIYNFIELRAELERLGHRFFSHSDTEVVLAAFAQWGPSAFSRFTGMFALALLDVQRGTLTLARDPFGIKPLYYAFGDGALFFASELPALLEFARIPRDVDPERLYRFLRYGVTDEGTGTLLSGVRQLPAAHFATIALDAVAQPAPIAYWQPDTRTDDDISFSEAAGTLRDKFLNSVALHLRSDVPVGTALSGGIDSSAIVAAIRAVQPDARIHAFSYVAAGTEFDEERWIDMAGRHAGAQVHKVRTSPEQLRGDLDALTAAQGEPFGSTSIYAQYRVFEAAKQAGIKVMLDGQGADELFGGYRQYLGTRLAALLRQGRIPQAWRFLRAASRLPGVSASYIAQKAFEHLLPQALQEPARRLVGREMMPSWMNQMWFSRAGVAAQRLAVADGSQLLKAMLLQDLRATNLPGLLRYEDRNSMAFSIESRVPFLTTDLADFVLRLPERFFIANDGTTKYIFREAMRGLVPDAILDRRDKIGFATPEAQWLRSLDGWARDILDGEAAAAIPALDAARTKQLWDATLSGKRPFDFQLWRILNLISWSERLQVRYAS